MTTEKLRQICAFGDRLLKAMLLAIFVISFCAIFSVLDPDVLNAIAMGAVMILLPSAYFMRGLERQALKLLRRLMVKRQTTYLVVASALAIVLTSIAVRVRRMSFLAMALCMPRLPDINLSPRLLPVPRAHMGAV